MTKKRLRELERIYIVRTIMRLGPASAVAIAEATRSECDADRFAGLSGITNRGITPKLNGMSLAQPPLVTGDWPGDGRPMVWSLTKAGRQLACAEAPNG